VTRNIHAFCDAGDIRKLHFKVTLYITIVAHSCRNRLFVRKREKL